MKGCQAEEHGAACVRIYEIFLRIQGLALSRGKKETFRHRLAAVMLRHVVRQVFCLPQEAKPNYKHT